MALRIICGAFWVCALAWITQARGETLFVAGGDGVYAFEFDPESGRLGPAMLAAKLDAPAWLAAHPSGWFLLGACNQEGGGAAASQLASFFVEPNTARLNEIGRVETGGAKAVYVEVDAAKGAVFVANAAGGTVAGFPLGADGKLGPRAVWIEHEGRGVVLPRQAEPHPHQVRVSPDGRHVYVPDLGTDEVFIYEYAKGGVLHPAANPVAKAGEGDGPCHLDFHPRLPVVYLTNEISSRVAVFQRNPQDGSLTALQCISSIPPDFRGKNACAEIRVHPQGGFVYASNRGSNSLAVFRVDEKGLLSPVQHQSSGGKSPGTFALHSSGKWLIAANQESGNLAVFAVDPSTGRLAATGEPVPVWGPVCLVFAPAP